MPISSKMNRQHRSPRYARKYSSPQRNLNSIAYSISSDVFNKKESLPVDRLGRVDIQPSHPDFKYWTEDEE